MRSKKKSSKKMWAVSEKLEIVQARLNGLTLNDVHSLYGASSSIISKWVRDYEARGIAGLESAPRSGGAEAKSQRVEAAEPSLSRSRGKTLARERGKFKGSSTAGDFWIWRARRCERFFGAKAKSLSRGLINGATSRRRSRDSSAPIPTTSGRRTS